MEAGFWRGLVGAVAIHAAVGGVLFFALPAPSLQASLSAHEPIWLDLNTTQSALEQPPAPPLATGPAGEQPSAPNATTTALPSVAAHTADSPRSLGPAVGAAGSAGVTLNDGTLGPDGIGTTGPGAGRGSAEGSSGTGDPAGPRKPRRGPIDTGLGGQLHWALVGPAPSATAPRPLSPTGGLQEALDQRDRSIGMGFGGPAASAVRGAANDIVAPRVGLATIEVVFDGAGKVQSARVLSATTDAAGWAAVASKARQMLAASRVRVPLAAQGLAVTLQVEARTQMPSGAKPGETVRPSGAGAEFDLSDLGATPSRAVYVRIVGERRL